jgi:hypothetical protein
MTRQNGRSPSGRCKPGPVIRGRAEPSLDSSREQIAPCIGRGPCGTQPAQAPPESGGAAYSRIREVAAQTRESVLDAAAELVVENGSVERPLPAVARRAGVSPATLFRYFPSERELCAALAERQRRAVSEDLTPRSVAEVGAALSASCSAHGPC